MEKVKVVGITPNEKIPIRIVKKKVILPPQSERAVREELYRITCNLFMLRELTPEDFEHKVKYLTGLDYTPENLFQMLQIIQKQLQKTKEIQANLKPW